MLSITAAIRRVVRSGPSLPFVLLAIVIGSLVLVEPVLAQAVGSDFCTSALADTVRNLFTIIQFGGPLIGGVIALGAIVATPIVPRADKKREMKELRNQGFIWGVVVAPLGTEIVQFLLNTVVSGGVSCGF